jgi:hypothetical protein
MIHVLQGKNQCGQACVAMLMNISLDDAIIKVGKKGKTNLRDLLPVLREKFIIDESRLKRLKRLNEVHTGILKIRWNKKQSHWVVKSGFEIYDPSFPCVYSANDYAHWVDSVGGKISSYLPLSVTNQSEAINPTK